MDVTCSLECVRAGCPEPDFLEKNGAWLLTIIGIGTGMIGGMFSYFLKSRCKHIMCWPLGLECTRDPLVIDAQDANQVNMGGSGLTRDDSSNA